MIGFVAGRVAELRPAGDAAGEVVVDVGGVGYRCRVPGRTLERLRPGREVVLHTHLHPREGALDLYGFLERSERDCFEALLGATGVGPRLALAILSVHTPGSLQAAVAADDLDALCLVPGVGRRSAQRLVVELRPRLEAPVAPVPERVPAPAMAEARAALEALGYRPDEVREALAALPAEGRAEELVRAALARLAVRVR